MHDSLLPVLVAFVALLIFFLVCREIVCWYWKINKSVELLEKIHAELKILNANKTP